LRGGYPELRAKPNFDLATWCGSYIRLYIERDVRQLLNVADLSTFARFVHLAAIRTGQILNISDLARDTGVSVPTVSRWLSILQSSYQVYLLQPYHANLSKRLIKAPKLYFGDTALASYLMGIRDPETLIQGPFLGQLFETAVFLEHFKQTSFSGESAFFTYFRTKDGTETDLVIEAGGALHLREIKTTRTIIPRLTESLIATEKLLKRKTVKMVLAPVATKTKLSGDVVVQPWHQVAW